MIRKKIQKDQVSIPGTYQIRVTRTKKSGDETCFTAYVPTNLQGLKELIRRHFRGIPGRKPEYFMRENEVRRF
jgi:hypothetical protein